MLRRGVEAFLEDLALASGSLAEPARRHARGAAEGAHEVGQVVEAGIERDVGDRGPVFGQQA